MSSKRVPWKQQRHQAARKGEQGFHSFEPFRAEQNPKSVPQQKQERVRDLRQRTSHFDAANEDY